MDSKPEVQVTRSRLRYIWLFFFVSNCVFVLITAPSNIQQISSTASLFNFVFLPVASVTAGIVAILVQKVPSLLHSRLRSGVFRAVRELKETSHSFWSKKFLFDTSKTLLNYATAAFFILIAVANISFWHYRSGSVLSYLVLWRESFGNGSILGNHNVIVFSVTCAYFVYVYTERYALGGLSSFKAGVSIFFLLGVHEALWYASYLTTSLVMSLNGRADFLIVVWYMSRSLFFIFIPLIMFVYDSLIGFSRGDRIFLGVTALYFLVWVVFGFPISSDLTSPTQYFNSIPVNLVEIFSWITAELVFLMTRGI